MEQVLRVETIEECGEEVSASRLEQVKQNVRGDV